MKKTIAVILSVLTFIVCMPFGATAQEYISEPTSVIVQLKGRTAIEQKQNGTNESVLFEKIEEEQKEVVSKIYNRLGYSVKKEYSFSNVLNGFSVTVDKCDVEKIKSVPNVKTVAPVCNATYEKAEEIDSKYVDSCCSHLGVDRLHAEGYTGKGQVIAVIDSEFDVNHEMFSGAIQSSAYTKAHIQNIISKKGLNVQISANRVYKSEKIPFAFNYESNTSDTYPDNGAPIHGTHVAGVLGGNNGKTPSGETLTGVAPDAQLVLMAVPTLRNDCILAALDDASKLEVDVVNCSWSADYSNTSFLEEAMDNLNNAGIFISNVTGNSSKGYEENLFSTQLIDYGSIGIPTLYDSTVAVASCDSPESWNFYNRMDCGENKIPYAECVGFFNAFCSGDEYPYVYCNYGTENDVKSVDLSGKIALVDRGGTLNYIDKQLNVKNAGGIGMILINTYEDFLVAFSTYDVTVPSAIIAKSSGEILKSAQNKVITISEKTPYGELKYFSSGGVSNFSGWGIGKDFEPAPDLTATGSKIYSSIPDDKYENKSGTSLAAPHISGIVACVNQFLEEKFSLEELLSFGLRSDLIRNMLMSTATPISELSGHYYSPRVQGSGLVNGYAATKANVLIFGTNNRAKIGLGDKLTENIQLDFTLKNISDKDITYDISANVTSDDYIEMGYQKYIVWGTLALKHTFNSPKTVTVPAHSSVDVSVKLSLDNMNLEYLSEAFTNGFYIDGFLSLSSQSDTPVIGLPFSGFYGDWLSEKTFDLPLYTEHGIFNETYLTAVMDNSRYVDDNNIWTLGKNIFDSSAKSGEDLVFFSPDGDGYFDTLGLQITPLRDTITSLKTKIIDSEGKVVFDDESTAECCGLTKNQFYFDDEDVDLPDGKYTLFVTSRLDYEGSSEETISFNFSIDRVKPKISQCFTYEKSGRTFLNVGVTDNNALMGLVLEIFDKQEQVSVVRNAIDGTTNYQAEFDITGTSLEDIKITVADYGYACSCERASDAITRLSKIYKGDFWELNPETGKLTIWGNGSMDDFELSGSQPYCEFSQSTHPWYSVYDLVKTVEIADGVTSIGNYAFFNCVNLESISIPQSVKTVGKKAFFNCKILNINTLEHIETIGENAFEGCIEISDLFLSGKVTNIENGAFANCIGLKSVVMGNGVQRVNDGSFNGCPELKSILFPNTISYLSETVFDTPNVTIRGFNGSYAQNFFDQNGIPFVLLSMGKLTDGEKITAADALVALRFSVETIELSAGQQVCADVDGNGKITSVDSLLILQSSIGLIKKFPVEN